jgi:hypothetical protein
MYRKRFEALFFFFVWYEPGPVRFYKVQAASMIKRVRSGQEIKHVGLARHDPFISKPVKPFFCSKSCLPVRLARFGLLFRAYRTGPFISAAGQTQIGK